jgi:hypothetical protein
MTERPPRTESELVALMHAIDVRAPESLHQRVEQLVAHRARPRRFTLLDRLLGAATRALSPMPRVAAAVALAGAAVALGILLSVGGTGRSGPSLRETASLTMGGATERAPRESPANGTELAAAVDGVAFPYWEGRLGWRSTGTRSDNLGGRRITTVFYVNARGDRVGYAIVGGLPAPSVGGGTTNVRRGVRYQLSRENGTLVVSWLRRGHLCVVSGHGVDGATLLRLASWQSQAQVRS